MSDLLKPNWTPELLALREQMRSRLNVARSIVDARCELGLSQEALGKLAGVKQSRISELEGSRHNVRFDTLDKVSRALGLMVELGRRRPMNDGWAHTLRGVLSDLDSMRLAMLNGMDDLSGGTQERTADALVRIERALAGLYEAEGFLDLAAAAAAPSVVGETPPHE